MTTPSRLRSRREFLSVGIGSLLVSGLGSPRAMSAPGPDFADPEKFLDAYVKMKGATDGRLTFSWHQGRRYAISDGKTLPLFGILAGTLATFTRIDDLRFERRSLEIVFHTDLDTGKLLERWDNPGTGQVVDVPNTRLGPSVLPLVPSGYLPSALPQRGTVDAESRFLTPQLIADRVWITEEIRVASAASAPEAGRFRYNEVNSLQGGVAELADPQRHHVASTLQYQSLLEGRSWAGPADTPTTQLSVAHGATTDRIDSLPPYWVTLVKQFHPAVLEDPLAALGETD